MARRWTIPFVSRKNRMCRIDIYDPSWTESVIELSTNNANAPGVAAEDPFYFEEDDDEDLLSVIRIKTGYINLIETTFGGLDALYPTRWNNRYVEVYYYYELVFRGYIQQQTFENDWCAVPREVSLPVTSILGMTEMFNVSLPSSTPITDIKLGYLMKQLIDYIDSSQNREYSRVVFPHVTDCPEFAGTIHPTVVYEKSSMFNQEYLSSKQPYEGMPFLDLLEAICNAYGWICHDLPDEILFTKFDHEDSGNNPKGYDYYAVNDLATASNRQTLSNDQYAYPMVLDNYMEPCDNDSSITQIMPMRLVTIQHEGDITGSVKADYSHMQCSRIFTYLRNGEEEYLIFLKNVANNMMPDISGDHLLDSNTPSTDGDKLYLADDGISVYDHNGTVQMVMRRVWIWATQGDTLATLYFFKRPILNSDAGYTDMRLKIDVLTGDSLNNLGTHEILYAFTYELWCGDTRVDSHYVSYNGDNYSIELSFNNVPNTGALRLVIKQGGVTMASRWPLLVFDKIELFYKEASYKKYVSSPSEDRLIGDAGGVDDGEVSMLISCQRVDDNMIGSTKINSYFSYYHYLRDSPQTRLQIHMRDKTELPMLKAYINRLQYWRASWRWRLIAMSFHPRDDKYQLTLHRSSTLE